MKTNDNTTNNSQMNSTEKLNGNSIDIERLIRGVKEEDAKNLRLTKTFQWAYIVIIIPYAALMFIPDHDQPLKLISGFFWIASFISYVLIFRKGYKEYKNIDYSLPVIEMLRLTAKRYQFQINKLLILFIPIVLMDAGLTLSFYHDLLPMNPINRVLIIQVIYWPVMIIAAIIGYFVWRTKQKPLRDNALKLIEELEGE
jgi:hypothetical protein